MYSGKKQVLQTRICTCLLIDEEIQFYSDDVILDLLTLPPTTLGSRRYGKVGR